MAHKRKILLASNSPRRRQLLALGGWEFRIVPADINEDPFPGEDPKEYVRRLAQGKAREVASAAAPGELIVAADTTVADGRQILGKPEDAAEARHVLKQLRAHIHQVYSAVAVYNPETDKMVIELADTDVPMRDYGDDEIEAYIETGDPFDKAGSYAIQHPEFKPVNSLSGCRANVVGLPLCHLSRTLVKFDQPPEGDIATACQQKLEYQCPVYSSILKGDL